MVVNIKQTWWHIEEIYHPSQARKIKHVMDLFTDQTEISLKLNDYYFVGLKVIARNSSNREIAFLEENTKDVASPIFLNLYPLESFPKVSERFSKNSNLRHIKLEIEYILTKPNIENFKEIKLIDKMKAKILPRKTTTIQIPGQIQPELYIIIPPGWTISEHGKSVGMKYYETITKSDEPDGINFEKIEEDNINFEEPFINEINRKYKYNYVITAEDYKKIREKFNKKCSIFLKFTYISCMSDFTAVISMIPLFIFLPISSAIFLSLIHVLPSSIFERSFGIGYLISTLSFLYFYFSLLKEQVFFPHEKLHYIIFTFTLIMIIILIIS